MSHEMKGRIVAITGANAGIGRATARALALAEGAGPLGDRSRHVERGAMGPGTTAAPSEASLLRHPAVREASMGAFTRELAARSPDPAERRWLFVPYDQLSDELGPLSREDPRELGIVLVESPQKARRRPYHKQKLALVLANLRHFALEQAARGVAVRHVVHDGPYRDALWRVLDETGPLRVMEPAERELRVDLAPLVQKGALEVLPHEGWLTKPEWFRETFKKGPPWRMDAFYRRARKETGLLMEGGRFVGGKVSFDADNRQPYKGEPPAPAPLRFAPDEVTREVIELVEARFTGHPGALDEARLPATKADAEAQWRFALERCLVHFGPFEDAMSRASTTLFHTQVSPLMNLHRLLPRRLVFEAAAFERAPLQSREGFVRQVLGWREFMRHVHRETDGFRALPPGDAKAKQLRACGPQPVAKTPGDGGYARGRGIPPARVSEGGDGEEGGVTTSFLDAAEPLPPAFWGAPSGLHCLDHVVAEVWREGYSHHITRLMVLSNLATLLGISPRALTDWFWSAYIDAYDWVVEPNVLGMGTFGLGELFVTKPYVSGAAYIDRMSDYCGACAFHPKKNCPLTPMYWAFLGRAQKALAKNLRVAMPLRSLAKRSSARQEEDRRVLLRVREVLGRGERLTP